MKSLSLLKLVVIVVLFMNILCNFAVSVSADESYGRLALDFSMAPTMDMEMEWKVYKVADIIDAEHFKLCDKFAVYPIKFDVTKEPELKSLAYTLSAYVASEKMDPTYVKKSKPTGTLIFDNIGEGYYLVKAEQVIDGLKVYSSVPLLVCIADGSKYGNQWNINTTVIPKIGLTFNGDEYKTINYAVKVTWQNKHDDDSEVVIEFYRDGIFYDKVKLSDENNWYYCWDNIPSQFNWEVKQESLPENYYVNYYWDFKDDNGSKTKHLQIVNTFEEDFKSVPTTTINPTTSVENSIPVTTDNKNVQNISNTKTLPQTGMNILPIPILSLSGLFLLGIGWNLVRKSR